MTYAIWEDHFSQRIKDDLTGACFAQLWNLEHETRIDDVLSEFKRTLGQKHGARLREGWPPNEAAESVLRAAIQTAKALGSPWIMLLPVPAGSSFRTQQMFTYITAELAARHSGLNETNLAPKVRLKFPLRVKDDGQPETPFIWVTFEPDSQLPADDPNDVACKLGLASVEGDIFLYRVFLNVDPKVLWIPTCLDAGLYEAWAPPPPDHKEPWGLTRHLTTGQPAKPELLTKTTTHLSDRPDAFLISRQPVGPLEIDYKANRP